MRRLALAALAIICPLDACPAADDAWTRCMTASGSAAAIVSACTRALKENPDVPPRQRALFIESRSDALMRDHRAREAIAGYTAAIALQPQDMEAYRSRGAAWMAVGRYEFAVQDLSAALRDRNPEADETTVSDIYYERAAAFRALGRASEYRTDCSSARRLDHRTPMTPRGCP